MDVPKAVQNYVNKMINEVTGMKVLLMDAETTSVISMVLTQTQLLQREVYLIDRLDNRQREKMRHLRCVCFVRPSPESIQALVEELREPKYGDYYLYFSNSLRKSDIERLAEVDEHEVVREVQEYFADCLAINSDLFSLNIRTPLYTENLQTWDPRTFQRSTDGILALLLSLKKKPLIRYERSSALARKLAAEVSYQMQQEGPLFDFRRPDTPPILLIMDRRNDPVTPLLLHWTYQALVHELIGIDNGRVDLSNLPDIRPELREVVLSALQDPFFQQNMYLTIGELGTNIKTYVDEYQTKHKSSADIKSITDMKRFVEDYPEFRKLSGNVTKHVTLVGEISRRVKNESLMEVSELEQGLAVSENHTQDVKTLRQLLPNSQIPVDRRIRLLLLYALRYEKSVNSVTNELVNLMIQSGVPESKLAVVSQLIQYAGTDSRLEDIFSNHNLISRTRNVFKGLQGVENVYTQHVPHLFTVLQDLAKGRLKDALYPFINDSTKDKPQDVIVFFIGGVTYAEAAEVAKINAGQVQGVSGLRVVIGGTSVLRGESFLKDAADSVSMFGGKGANISTTGKDLGERLRSNRIA
ncbi:Sec1-like protein [Gaertneriomyces semiglobifer]|nr:Sec1-like protein [Gaertneriomyces semiglobifer]